MNVSRPQQDASVCQENVNVTKLFRFYLFTFCLQLFGDASVAQSKLSNEANGDFFSINWGWAIGVMMGVLVAGGVSGMQPVFCSSLSKIQK